MTAIYYLNFDCFADLQSCCRDFIWVVQSFYQLIHFAEQFLDSQFLFLFLVPKFTMPLKSAILKDN
ncbi:hypothetical protein BpHYR1_018832 [Brachionus plicatilis]|uniref:Uncharacterized protein n=1 Tax=Brachionus plicatilis TaxID=10195 RepID=A0A3M7QS31_BRAPC|nr:hypothetical protein BpHYR1_018832 [Brachionus plicatilis]